jgi:hypothetical protein
MNTFDHAAEPFDGGFWIQVIFQRRSSRRGRCNVPDHFCPAKKVIPKCVRY